MIRTIAALIILMSAAFIIPVLLAAEEIPEPQGRISDYALVITEEYRAKISGLIGEVEAGTSAEIAVVTVKSIAPYDETAYARMIFDGWKIGKKGRDNGVLILVAVDQRRWRIETGYGLESILPDGLCGEIGRLRMVPYFREGRYGEGLYSGVAAIASVIAEGSGADMSIPEGLLSRHDAPTMERAPVPLLIFVPLFFFVWSLPWPVYVGLPVALLFAAALYGISPVMPFLVLGAYSAAMIVRSVYWIATPRHRRRGFFGAQTYGGVFTTGGWSGGGGFGGGGFGGGRGGGGGAGGGF